jgi:hypothetical protein
MLHLSHENFVKVLKVSNAKARTEGGDLTANLRYFLNLF